jgi:hypothetical protein
VNRLSLTILDRDPLLRITGRIMSGSGPAAARASQLVDRLFAFHAIFRPELALDAPFRTGIVAATTRILAGATAKLIHQ